MKYQIVNRTASNDHDAWEWANEAAGLGWRVVCVFPGTGSYLCVWAEAPIDADPDEWDRAHRAAYPKQYDPDEE
jgi:hypothetical protein